jgi:hypothetical protein
MSKAKLFVSMLVVAVLVSFSTSFAQQLPADKAGHKADYLYSKLKLDKDQYTKVYQSLLTYETKVKDLKGDKKANAEAMKKLQAEQNTELGKIFTKDQASKFDGMKEKLYKQSFKKKKAVKKEGVEEKKDATKEGTKDMKKEEKKDAKKDMKKDEKKDAKKDAKKEVKKDEKKDAKKDVKKDEKKDVKKDEKKDTKK